MCRHQCKATENMKNPRKMIPSMEHNNFLVTDLEEIEIYKLPGREFKIIVLRKLSELQETKMDNSMKSGKQYMAKMRDSTKRQK